MSGPEPIAVAGGATPLYLEIEMAAAGLRTTAVRCEQCFGVVQLSAETAMRICFTNYRGREIVSLRVWWRAPDGRWLPTKKGFTLKPSDVATVVRALQLAEVFAATDSESN